jgi:hypothetical protein
VIPGLIFISYIYEFGFIVEDLSYKSIMRIVASTTDDKLQRQACRTLIKMVVKHSGAVISSLLHIGVFAGIVDAMRIAKFRNKVGLALLACYIIKYGGEEACKRVYVTKSVNIWLDFFELEDDELSIEAIDALERIFGCAAIVTEECAAGLQERFFACGGLKLFQKLMHHENDEIVNAASSFWQAYLGSLGERVENDDEENDLE